MGLIDFPPGARVGADSNIIVYTVEDWPPYAVALAPFWHAAERGDIQVLASALCMAETLVIPRRNGDATLDEAYQDLLLRSTILKRVDVSTEVLDRAASLRAFNRALRTPDAIHLASAILEKCSHFLTNDRRLAGIRDIEVIVLGDYVTAA